MGRREQLEAELAVVELEDRLKEVKADPKATDEELAEVKHALRGARQAHRELREAAPPEESADAAVVRPGTVKAKAGVKTPGGKG
jgi:hypothetical protein